VKPSRQIAKACPGEVDPVRRSRTSNKESTALPGSRRFNEWFTTAGKLL
jgi:hypothetical protein